MHWFAPAGGSPSKDEDAAAPAMHTRSTRDQEQAARRETNAITTYEVTFVGPAGTVLQAEFDDCEISVGPSTTTLRLPLADQGALHGLLQRITSSALN